MYLKSLTISGFKSFAKKSELEFSSPITAIVGPNGSGKSNTAEAFRFVLGEQSVKSLRGTRGEDLIWGGSEQASRGNRAQVELVLDNAARTFALDFDEVKIERIVHRDGQNEYKLNGSAVRLKDIHELLAQANIGATGHHIISQGEADRVLSANAKERRAMIEDALGLKVYQMKKQESERKLTETEKNIEQVESLRREAAPHLKYLKKQVERAARAREVQAELRTTYTAYLKREDVYVAHHTDRLTAAEREPQKALEKVRERITKLKQSLSEETVEPDTTKLTEAEAALRERAATRQAAERALGQLEGQIAFLERRLTAPGKPAAKAVSREELEDLVTVIENDIEKVLGKEDVSALERALKDLAHQLKAFLKRSEGTAVDTAAADEEELAALTKAQKDAAAAVEEAREAEAKAQEKVAAARAMAAEVVKENHEAERELFTLINEQRELEAKLNDIERELMQLERDRADFKRELQEAVVLLGRGAADYIHIELTNESGEAVTKEVVVAEDRSIQRERQRALEKLKIRLEELGIGSTEDLEKEYTDAKERDEFLANELGDLSTSVDNLTTLISDLDGQLETEFKGGIDKIGHEFEHFFKLMFGGGEAKLEVVTIPRKGDDEEEGDGVTETGVSLSVKLPNKRVKGLNMLSGGERALTSIALIFAMSQVNPPPFIILDETDAALDEANSRRYGDMIEALAAKSQLVLITHNRETMSRAGILYGITMGTDGVSKILSVKFDEASVVAK